jgi:hypothetical protein
MFLFYFYRMSRLRCEQHKLQTIVNYSGNVDEFRQWWDAILPNTYESNLLTNEKNSRIHCDETNVDIAFRHNLNIERNNTAVFTVDQEYHLFDNVESAILSDINELSASRKRAAMCTVKNIHKRIKTAQVRVFNPHTAANNRRIHAEQEGVRRASQSPTTAINNRIHWSEQEAVRRASQSPNTASYRRYMDAIALQNRVYAMSPNTHAANQQKNTTNHRAREQRRRLDSDVDSEHESNDGIPTPHIENPTDLELNAQIDQWLLDIDNAVAATNGSLTAFGLSQSDHISDVRRHFTRRDVLTPTEAAMNAAISQVRRAAAEQERVAAFQNTPVEVRSQLSQVLSQARLDRNNHRR